MRLAVPPLAFADVVAALEDFMARRRDLPEFLVLDGETHRRVTGEFETHGFMSTSKQILPLRTVFLGLIVVVMPTDGVPLLRVLGSAQAEALRAAPERSEAV